MKKESLNSIYSEFGELQKHLNNINNSLKGQNISNEIKSNIKNLKDSFIGLSNSLNQSVLNIDNEDKKHFNFYHKVTKNIDNYLQHVSMLGGSIGQFSFQSYKVLKDYTNLFDNILSFTSLISKKIKKYKKNTLLKLTDIDNNIQEYVIKGDKYTNKVIKLQKVGDKLVNKQILKLEDELEKVEKEEIKLSKQKERLTKVFGSQELQEKELQPQYNVITQQKLNIQSQLQVYEQKHDKYIQYITTFSKKISEQYQKQQQKVFNKMIDKNFKRIKEINKEMPDLVKKTYDNTIKESLRLEYANMLVKLQKVKQSLEEQNKQLKEKLEFFNINTPTKSSFKTIFSPLTSILSIQFNKKSPLIKLSKRFMNIWGVFTKGIKTLIKLPQLLSPYSWLFKIGGAIAGFVTLMISSPTFRKLVMEGIKKIGVLIKNQFIYLQKKTGEQVKQFMIKVGEGLKWLVWDKPINLIDKYISTPISNYFKSIPGQLSKAGKDISKMWNNVTSFASNTFSSILDYIKNNPVTNFIKTTWSNITSFVSSTFSSILDYIKNNSITDFVKTTWNKIISGIKNIFGWIGYTISHPLHFKSYSDYLKDIQEQQVKQEQKQIQENIKNYPVVNPNSPLISKSDHNKLIGKEIEFTKSIEDIQIQDKQLEQITKQITFNKNYKQLLDNINITPEQNSTIAPLHKQKGGLVTGIGGQTDDKILTQLSNGEYVVPQNIVKSYPMIISALEQLRNNNINLFGIKDIFDDLKDKFNDIKIKGINVFNDIKNSFKDIKIKDKLDDIVSSTKDIFSKLKNNISISIDEHINKSIKDIFEGKVTDAINDIKDIFKDIKKSSINAINDFKDIIPQIKKSFIDTVKDFNKKQNDISSEIKDIGNIASSIGLSGIGGFLSKIAGPVGVIQEGGMIMHNINNWLNDTIADPINHFMHGIFSWWGDSTTQKRYQNGGLVPGGISLFDNINQKLSSGEYIIPNYITTSFPSLIKKIDTLRLSLLPNKNNIINTNFDKNILIDNNPLVKLVNESNSNFNKLSNSITKLFTEKKPSQEQSTVIQNNNVNSTQIGSLDNYDLILGDISI